MKKIISLLLCGTLLLLLFSCSGNSKQDSDDTSANQTWQSEENVTDALQIRVEGTAGENIVFQLNDSIAAKALYEQLPLSIQVENYSNNEKIFYSGQTNWIPVMHPLLKVPPESWHIMPLGVMWCFFMGNVGAQAACMHLEKRCRGPIRLRRYLVRYR